MSNGSVVITAQGNTVQVGYDPNSPVVVVGELSYFKTGINTVPMSYFVPSQSGGQVPLGVYFWDYSLGATSWSWNFGDGSVSSNRSPFYTFTAAQANPYNVVQSISGPGGSNSSSRLITPTTPHSISGNIANANGFKVGGATVNLNGSLSRTVQTDGNGNYSFINLTANGNYTVSVTKNGYRFAPPTQAFVNLNGTQTGNFTAKLNDKPSDFDGDGKTDASVFRPGTNDWFILNSSNSSISGVNFALTGDKIVSRDYDGDGKTDVAVWRPSDGNWCILQSSNNTVQIIGFGASGDIPVANDYDGDDKADTAVFRPSNGVWYVLKSSDSQFVASQFALDGDLPVSGDYDGDEKADFAVFRPSNSTWIVLRSSDSNVSVQQFGNSGDKFAQGDYDGDNKTDFATFRPGDLNWRVKRSSDGVETIQSWGLNSDIPVPGDYDGDGKYDVSVFRPGDGNWYIIRSSDQSFYPIGFGTTGDYPTLRSYYPE